MAEKKVRLTKPILPETAIPELINILKEGYWTQGVQVREFEQQLADYLGIDHVVVVSSGTAALHLALLTIGIGRGDEVIIPAFSFAATANVVKLCGATPVFVDIKPDDLCLDTGLLEGAITENTKAIMPVHEFGAVVNMHEISTLTEKYDIKVIEDAACALGSLYQDHKAGTMGDMGCFSFHPRKIITTGEGGAIATSCSEYAGKLRLLRNHGSTGKLATEGFLVTGLNYRMTDFQALLGVEQLRHIDEIIKIRESQAEYYARRLVDIPWLQLPRVAEDVTHSWQSYHITVKDNKRDTLIKHLNNNGIESNIGAQFLPALASLKEHRYRPELYKQGSEAYNNGMVIPIGAHLDANDLELIVDCIREYKHERI